ncbi:MAG: family 78 glycoside hydrolase catalytic domain, partial [Clostridiales bacterium]|nr:family 78 glycoside hydrolase catalytic domain [Clostridiales bacterium]
MTKQHITDAMWICADSKISSPLFKRVFTIDKSITSAVLSCTGLGYFEAYLNGEKVGLDVLIPAQTDYEDRQLIHMKYPMNFKSHHRVMYLDYDVTEMIAQGDNALGMWLGNGFYRQTERYIEGNISYGDPKMMLCLDITYEDGSTQSILSDDSHWYTHTSPILFNNIFFGEKYDANLEIDDWCAASSSVDGWDMAMKATPVGGRLVKQDCPTDRVQEVYTATCLYKGKNRTIYDIKQNISGFLTIKVSGIKGQKVNICFAGNIKDDYSLDFESTGGEKQIQQLEYILNDKPTQSYTPRFTWAAFRYCEVTTDADIIDIHANFVCTDIKKTGEFHCSNELFNKLFDLYSITQRANIHGCITSDCPHRERLSYTGDGQLVTEPLMLSFDGYSFIRKWIKDLKDGQNIDTGYVAHTIPFMGGGGGPAWGSAIVITPWRYYLQTGDLAILEEMYKPMQRWMDYLETRTDGDYIIHREEPGGWCLGDWCTPGETVIPESYVNTCYYAHIALLMIDISEKLNISTAQYEELYKSIRNAIITKWYDTDTNSFSIGSQGTDALALWAKVVPDDGVTQVAQTMADHITNDCNGHLDTGIIATPILLDMLTEYGHFDVAYNNMDKKTYPSFGYMLEHGATTLWERFEKVESDNHPMFGTYTAWFIKILVGINIDTD